jgi:hypothetical protein
VLSLLLNRFNGFVCGLLFDVVRRSFLASLLLFPVCACFGSSAIEICISCSSRVRVIVCALLLSGPIRISALPSGPNALPGHYLDVPGYGVFFSVLEMTATAANAVAVGGKQSARPCS